MGWRRGPPGGHGHTAYLFEPAVQVELPPVEVIDVKGEVIVLPAVAGVRQHVAATLGEAQEDVTVWQTHACFCRARRGGREVCPPREPKGQGAATRDSPCPEKLLAHNGLEGHTDPRWKLPEQPLGHLTGQLLPKKDTA